jgi:hypothetical protein
LLTPALLEHLSGRRVEHCSPHEADIIAVGSVLEPGFWAPGSWTGFAGYIWGAGRMTGEKPMEMPAARVAAVRGKWTLRALGCRNKEAVCLGDPGLLACLLAEKKKARYKLGIIPHWSEFLKAAVSAITALSPEILLIDPCGSLRGVLDNICRCQHILSSSLLRALRRGNPAHPAVHAAPQGKDRIRGEVRQVPGARPVDGPHRLAVRRQARRQEGVPRQRSLVRRADGLPEWDIAEIPVVLPYDAAFHYGR